MNKSQKCLLFAYNLGYRCDEEGNVSQNDKESLKLYPDTKGYLCFSIKLDETIHYRSISRAIPVHRLQAYQKFGDKIFDKNIQVRHLDSNCQNNCWDNLEVGTPSDNSLDRPEENRLEQAIAASNHIRRFTDLEMLELKEFHNKFKSYSKTMEKFSISSKGTLHNMLNKIYKTTKP